MYVFRPCLYTVSVNAHYVIVCLINLACGYQNQPRGVVVHELVESTKLLYVEPG